MKKVSELFEEELSAWTARAQGWEIKSDPVTGWYVYYDADGFYICQDNSYRPDINAGQAMGLAKKFGLIMNFEIGEVWKCGRTYPISEDYSAICRAVVDFVFGEYVEEDVCI